MPRLLLLLILSIIACCIEVEISVPGFPEIARYFHVSDSLVQWTIAINFVGFCLAGLFYGPLSESFGRRKVMVLGNALLLAGAAGCVFAPSIDWLLFSRFIQGIGASASAVVVFAMIADVYQGEKAAKLIGIMNSVLTTLIAIAPVAGGFINQAIGWRGNYGAVAIICLISWILLLFLLPETKAGRQAFDLKKVLRDYRGLLSSGKFIQFSVAPSLLYAAYMSFVACGSFLYMETYGLSILAYTLHLGCIVGSFSLISFLSGRIIERLGRAACAMSGVVLCAIGSFGLLIVSFLSPYSPVFTTVFMIIFCVGFAIFYPVVFAASLEIFPEIKGTASSVIMSMRAFLVAALTGTAGYLYNGELFSVAAVVFMAIIPVCLSLKKIVQVFPAKDSVPAS